MLLFVTRESTVLEFCINFVVKLLLKRSVQCEENYGNLDLFTAENDGKSH